MNFSKFDTTVSIMIMYLLKILQQLQQLENDKTIITYPHCMVDSLCRDGVDLPRAPYIGKACTRLNGAFLGV